MLLFSILHFCLKFYMRFIYFIVFRITIFVCRDATPRCTLSHPPCSAGRVPSCGQSAHICRCRCSDPDLDLGLDLDLERQSNARSDWRPHFAQAARRYNWLAGHSDLAGDEHEGHWRIHHWRGRLAGRGNYQKKIVLINRIGKIVWFPLKLKFHTSFLQHMQQDWLRIYRFFEKCFFCIF